MFMPLPIRGAFEDGSQMKNVENELNAVKSVGDREHRYSKARGMGPMCPLREQAARR